jgi:hypothetical protein
MKKRAFPALLAAVWVSLTALGQQGQQPRTIEWSVASQPTVQTLDGDPQIVETPLGQAIRFNGETDGVFLEENPLKGMTQFTLEVIFRPDGDGKFAQRFMHMGTSAERILFETRVNPDKTWYFDAHTQLPAQKGRLTLIDEKLLHPTDRWYNVTLVNTGTMLTTYVNGTPQKWGFLNYVPINEGITSVGVRQNRVDYFKGTIYKIRVTPRALVPGQFLKDYEQLNQ